MPILKVVSENVKATYSKENFKEGYFNIGGKWHHWAWDGGEHFVEGQEVEGRILQMEGAGTDGTGKLQKHIYIGFEPDHKHRPPKFSYLYLENRKVDFTVLGHFVGDCTLCGEKNVVEHTHVMGDCPKKHKGKVNAIVKAQENYFKKIKKNAAKFLKERQKPKKKERIYEMKFKIKNSGHVGLTGPFENKKEALKHAKKLKATVSSIKFLGWK